MKKIISLFLSVLLTLTVLSPTFIPQSEAAASVSGNITEQNPVVVIRVSNTTGKRGDGLDTGTFGASIEKKGTNFILYDVVIGNTAIGLFQFGENYNTEYSENIEKYGTDKVAFNKAYRIANYTNKTGDARSACIRKAMTDICKKVHRLSPSCNTILKWSGHGMLGFAGMTTADTVKMMTAAVNTMGCPFIAIDFSSNCVTSTTTYLNLYAPYAIYMAASQTNQGGYTMDSWDYEKYEKVDDDSQYCNIFSSASTVEEGFTNLLKLNLKWWPLCKKSIKTNKAKESNTLIDLRVWKSFATEFRKKISEDKLYSSSNRDLYAIICKYGNSTLKSLYKKLVLYYNENTKYITWENKCYGIYCYDMPAIPTALKHTNTVWKLTDYYYYYNESGKKDTKKNGAVTASNGNTYFLTNGIAATDAVKKVGTQYIYFDITGAKNISASGLKKVGSSYYYFTKGVASVKTLKKISGKLHYFGANGKMVKSKTFTANGKKYTADSKGVCTSA